MSHSSPISFGLLQSVRQQILAGDYDVALVRLRDAGISQANCVKIIRETLNTSVTESKKILYDSQTFGPDLEDLSEDIIRLFHKD